MKQKNANIRNFDFAYEFDKYSKEFINKVTLKYRGIRFSNINV